MKRLIVPFALVALAGCTSDLDDLKQFVRESDKRVPPKIEPLPAVKPFEPFTYEGFDLPDPFKPRKLAAPKEGGGGLAPDLNRRKEPLEAYKQQRVEIEQSFGALLKQLPNKSEMDALLIDINQAGLGRGLAFDLFKPAEKENFTEFYAELPVNIKVTGNYHDLGAFASDVAKMPRIVLLTDIKIDPPKDGLLSMEAVAKTYRYLDAEEIAKQRQANKPKPGAKK